VAETFYAQQAANRRRSVVLLVLMGLSIVVVAALVGYASGQATGALRFAQVAVPIAFGYAVGAYEGGDALILRMARAQPMASRGRTQVLNVVRELAIAANIPMPKMYVIQDAAANLFAIGRDPRHASLAVTTGLLSKLDREELQGVVGHELAHLRNFDTRFSMLTALPLGAVFLVSDSVLHGAPLPDGGRVPLWQAGARTVLLVSAMAIGLVLAFVAPLIAALARLTLNREREYLADATAVELTRNPLGLEGALAKIGADRHVLQGVNRGISHLFFVNPEQAPDPRRRGWRGTHPSIPARIERLRRLHGIPALRSSPAWP
jgi:heat shock protein HtpX